MICNIYQWTLTKTIDKQLSKLSAVHSYNTNSSFEHFSFFENSLKFTGSNYKKRMNSNTFESYSSLFWPDDGWRLDYLLYDRSEHWRTVTSNKTGNICHVSVESCSQLTVFLRVKSGPLIITFSIKNSLKIHDLFINSKHEEKN